MLSDGELEQLQRDVQYLKDRAEIVDCIANQSRGHDRHDAELMTEVYHADGVDEHGPNVYAGPEYADCANETHTAVFEDHLHHLTTQVVEIEGDTAHAETYNIGTMRPRGGKVISVMGGAIWIASRSGMESGGSRCDAVRSSSRSTPTPR